MSFAKVILIGNVGRKPELRFTAQGIPVCTVSVAVSMGKQDDEPLWFSVSCWRRLAELATEFLTTGRQVYVEGRLSLDTWEGRDGGVHTSLHVDADELRFLDRPELRVLPQEQADQVKQEKAQPAPANKKAVGAPADDKDEVKPSARRVAGRKGA